VLETLHTIAESIALALEAFSVLVITLGAIDAAYHILGPYFTRRSTHGVRRQAWLSLGRWLMLGLEFLLAADIVHTALSPSWEQIGELGAIAVIRTFLNYFLERDLEKAMRERPEVAVAGGRERP
jgi:uncharacterized membrane protein